MTRLALLLAIGLGMVGCAAAQEKVINTAAFDHGCPPEKVRVLRQAEGLHAYELDVCGKQRKYRDFGNDKAFVFVDVTDGAPKTLPPRD